MLLVGVAVWINGDPACAAAHSNVEEFAIAELVEFVAL